MQPSKDCVQKTLKRLEEKVQGRVLKQVHTPAVSSVAARPVAALPVQC